MYLYLPGYAGLLTKPTSGEAPATSAFDFFCLRLCNGIKNVLRSLVVSLTQQKEPQYVQVHNVPHNFMDENILFIAYRATCRCRFLLTVLKLKALLYSINKKISFIKLMIYKTM